MAGFRNIDDLRQIEFARTHLWDIKIEEPTLPVPFNDWFPASSVDEPLGGVSSTSTSFATDQYFYPVSRHAMQLQITTFDDSVHTLENFFKDWVHKEIFLNGLGVAPLKSCVRRVHIMRLSPQKVEIQRNVYLCYPDNNMSCSLNSGSDAKALTINFRVVGKEEVMRNGASPEAEELPGLTINHYFINSPTYDKK